MADNTVKMTFQAVVQGAVGEINKLKGALEQLNNSTLGKTVKGLTGFNLSTLASSEMLLQVGKALKKTITDYSEYAEAMDKSSKLAGVSVDEMSRLTQAADDFRVSQDSLKTAMGMALKNGFTPTIENLAKLSDEFIAIKDPADRAALASKIFGRGWQEIAPLLLKGGDAIRSGTAAIADNLVVTDKAVQANNEYIKAMDDLGDAWTGVKNSAAQTILPALTDIINALNGNTNEASIAGGGTAGKSNLQLALEALKKPMDDVVPVGKDMNEMLYDTGPASEAATAGLVPLADATNNADAAMRKYSAALLFTIASKALGDNEEAVLALAQRMGLVDEKTVLATKKAKEYADMLNDPTNRISLETYNNLVSGLADSLDRLESKTITVTYNQVTTGTAPNGYWQAEGGNGSTQTGRASGGPVMAGNPYLWQESAITRPETFVPSQNGYVLTKQDAQAALSGAAGGRGGNTYNIHWNGDYRQLAAELDRQAQLRRLMA